MDLAPNPDRLPSNSEARGRRIVFVALGVMVFAFLGGLGTALRLIDLGALDFSVPRDGVAYFLFAENEPEMMGGMAILLLGAGWFLGRRGAIPSHRLGLAWEWLQPRSAVLWTVLPGVTVAVALLGRYWVQHDFALSMDEHLAEYQAAIFATGNWRATVPGEWIPLVHGLTPHFVTYSEASQTWVTSYWPLHSVLLAPFVRLGVPGLLNALLAGGSVWLIADIARKLWGDSARSAAPACAWAAALLLLASPQFVITAMTSYALPAHLFLNLLWVRLYQEDTTWSLLLVPLIGVIALGLHKPNVHGLFVAPFCLRVVLDRRWRVAAWFAAVYLLGLWLCYRWKVISQPPPIEAASSVVSSSDPTGLLKYFELPAIGSIYLRLSTLPLLFSWQCLLTGALSLSAVLRWRELPTLLRDLALGSVALWFFYFIGRYDQGHGWGYRYCHATMGNLVLLSVAGLHLWRDAFGRDRVVTMMAAALGFGFLVQWPVRCLQVEQFVAPYARADAYLARQTEAIVVIQTSSSWYSRDLVRNRFDLSNRPLRINREKLTREETARLMARKDFRVIRFQELQKAGVRPMGRAALLSD